MKTVHPVSSTISRDRFNPRAIDANTNVGGFSKIYSPTATSKIQNQDLDSRLQICLTLLFRGRRQALEFDSEDRAVFGVCLVSIMGELSLPKISSGV